MSAFLQIFQLTIGQKFEITLVATFIDFKNFTSWTSVFHYLDPSLPLLKSRHEKLQASVLVNLFSMGLWNKRHDFIVLICDPPWSSLCSRVLYSNLFSICYPASQPVWPDWTLGKLLKPLATINLPKSHTLLGNFCKGVKNLKFFS